MIVTYRILFISALITLFYISCSDNHKNKSNIELQEIEDYLRDSTRTKDEKLKKIDDFYSRALEINSDSIKNKHLINLSYKYLKLFPNNKFLRVNQSAYEISVIRKDSLGIASVYWDRGEFYYRKKKQDSAYFYYNKAQQLYSKLGKDYNAARLLLNIAIVEKNIGDYTGSEISTAKAIPILKDLNKNEQLYSAYNNLGILSNELKEYNGALKYYEDALYYIEKANIEDQYPSLWNNIGIVYFNKKNYREASSFYRKALDYDSSLRIKNTKLYAMLLDNLAISNLHEGNVSSDLLSDFTEALQLRETFQFKDGITINKIHIGEYYLKHGDTTKAITFFKEARSLAKKTLNYRDMLTSLNLLANIEVDSSVKHLRKYININDSLNDVQRQTRKKFTMLRFQTDEYISQTEKLSRNITIIIISSILVVMLFISIYVISSQRAKYNKLQLIQQKDNANREIYNLTLSLRKKFNEGIEQERYRISRELHDGILGRIFGVRLSLESLNEEDNDEAKRKRSNYLDEIQNISEDIRIISHRLNEFNLPKTNFYSILKELINSQRSSNSNMVFELFVDSNINWKIIDDNIKINLYRIIQESLTNCQKYSKASKVKVTMSLEKGFLMLNVEDNGIGFDKFKNKEGIGIKNMRTRTKNINGVFNIISNETDVNGATINVIVKI